MSNRSTYSIYKVVDEHDNELGLFPCEAYIDIIDVNNRASKEVLYLLRGFIAAILG